MQEKNQDLELIKKLLEIYDQKALAQKLNNISPGSACRETINRWVNGKAHPKLSHKEFDTLASLLPSPENNHPNYDFDFIDLFAGIGGIRRGFDKIGGRCVFTSEWNEYAVRTYKANYYCDPTAHKFNSDIRDVTLSNNESASESDVIKSINSHIPDHDVLLAGFPCQPFSIAGVSKKNSLGRSHGFECKTQGTLFFDVAKIIEIKKPCFFVLENVKNLKSHDKGRTFKIIMETLDELGYHVADSEINDKNDPKVIDGQHFTPQHRERIILVGFRRDLNLHKNFTLKNIEKLYPSKPTTLGDILEKQPDAKYTLTPKLWEYLFNYAKKHKAKGNGFGFGLVGQNSITRTLSARYHKDGSEILVDRGFDFSKDFYDQENIANRPRRLTPRECARLMGYDAPNESSFKIPVSDTQAYKQFGNSVVVPVFESIATLLKPLIISIKNNQK